jgi:hypothetical protein
VEVIYREKMTPSTDSIDPYPPNVGIVFRGTELDPQKISTLLGLDPESSFKKGSQRNDGKKWPHGFWMFSSSGRVQSSEFMTHLLWLVEQIEPAKTKIIKLLKEENIDGEINCFWIMPSSQETLVFDPDLLKRIAELEIRVELSIYSPDNKK